MKMPKTPCANKGKHPYYSRVGKTCKTCGRTWRGRKDGRPIEILTDKAKQKTFLQVIGTGMTYKEACLQVGIDPSTWSRYKRWVEDGVSPNGDKRPPPDDLVTFCKEVERAQALHFIRAAAHVSKAANEGNLKANLAILRRHPAWAAQTKVEHGGAITIAGEARERLRKAFPLDTEPEAT